VSSRARSRSLPGAATGIGKAIAHAFGAAGAYVVVNHLDTPDLAEAVVAQVSRDGSEALAVAADSSSRARFEALVAAAIARFGRWDVLVNNAGTALVKPFSEVTEDEFDTSFEVNVKGTFHGCQLALERMAVRSLLWLRSSPVTVDTGSPRRTCG
jgi:NAD(P)-dependent dehydrogenase (short-subunit alcohol dehydrogenase family)